MGERAASERVIERVLELLADSDGSVRSAATESLGKLSSKVAQSSRPEVARLALAFARKRGKSGKAGAQRNAGYVALRNLMAAEVK
jgi:HEAT repeat protein